MKPETKKYLDAVRRRLRTERSMVVALYAMTGHILTATLSSAAAGVYVRQLEWRAMNTRAIAKLACARA